MHLEDLQKDEDDVNVEHQEEDEGFGDSADIEEMTLQVSKRNGTH